MKLTKEYIQNKHSSMFKNCFDFSIGNGWLPMVEGFCQAFPNHEIVQIKEKFAGLRIYLNGGSDKAYDFIAVLETLSYLICEECGSPAEVKTSGWIRSLCRECANGKDSVDIYK